MKTLIIFDSIYGNTQKIANSIASSFDPKNEVKVLKVTEANISDLDSLDLLVVGTPVHGGRPSPSMQAFLNSIPNGSLKNIKVAVFDTRVSINKIGFLLRLLVKTIGFASPKMLITLKNKGASIISTPQGFIVNGNEGPLEEGELDRAKDWAKTLK